MKVRALANLGRALAVCLLSTLAAPAQEAPQPQPAPDKLVVQVVYKKGAQPAYLAVPGTAWYAFFGHTPAASSRAAADTVQAVDVSARLEDGRVSLKVGVHVGERFFDRLDVVATYTAAAGEAVEARDLERFGVEPFVFKVLRVSASDTAAPVVVNRTQSVAAAVTDFTPDPLPLAKLTLTNLSSKRVRAVALETTFQGRRRTSILAFNPDGKPLMEPGGTYERKIGITEGQRTGESFTPQSIDGVVVAAVLFEDYTFEGDADSAARRAMLDEGLRVQLPRLLRFVRAAHDSGGAETAEDVRRFKAAISALDDAAPQSSVDKVLNAYPGLTPAMSQGLKGGIEVSMHKVRTELLGDLERFEKRFQAAPADNSFQSWLAEQRSRLEAWLARL
ncbi:MAG TPA: hypothetical protein VN282_14680 [Pyrinomonadaceae bacterium]|nr:hypothetical protein [Pyrinomonadaceae bacterium]